MSQTHVCPHCNQELTPWLGPPESGWGEILVCNNNECPYFKGSPSTIRNTDEASPLGCRYALDPANDYTPFSLVAWHGACRD
ncbi:hypothetical protein NNJEOMEG_02473 [Fundidesulfovibrio magnetotacticus]|uniref:Uncharacterized protein n=1 Tax=Fundidesulfovibrio magnetotacticus TaxID=2730080 RepID=A0A6V8LXT7_9BACT|nr:hypothetical protein [Fundidesulfovibrio magnetotacticus]GFK94626.1 hypothetical protein NNJEOMEG_02473 [Fundidesulfovibrio magnetotacticus]